MADETVECILPSVLSAALVFKYRTNFSDFLFHGKNEPHYSNFKP